jgi:hypothetical protein
MELPRCNELHGKVLGQLVGPVRLHVERWHTLYDLALACSTLDMVDSGFVKRLQLQSGPSACE